MIQSKGVWMVKTPFTTTLRDINTMASHTPNFASILDEAPTEVTRPPTFPAGTYLCIVGDFERGESNKKKTPFLQFALKPVQAMDDVDTTALEEFGEITDRELNITFYLTEGAVFMLDEFHANCGLDLSTLGKVGRLSRCELVQNAEVLAVVEHEPAQDNSDRVFARVRRTAKAA